MADVWGFRAAGKGWWVGWRERGLAEPLNKLPARPLASALCHHSPQNRELQIIRMMTHPNIVQLKHCFYTSTEKDEVYLNLVGGAGGGACGWAGGQWASAALHLRWPRSATADSRLLQRPRRSLRPTPLLPAPNKQVLEYVPDTVYRINKHYTKNEQRMPLILVRPRHSCRASLAPTCCKQLPAALPSCQWVGRGWQGP